MSHVVIVTKPSYALAALPALRRRHPDRRIVGVIGGTVSLLTFDYPRGLSMSDYPFVSGPRWKPSPERMRLGASFEVTDGVRVSLDQDPFDLIRKADVVICADGDHYGGAANFHDLMTWAGGDELARRPHEFLRFSSSRPDAIATHVEAMGTTLDDDFLAYLEGGLVKRRFDWCFAVNSQALLGAAYRKATDTALAVPIGKYALQLLYAMRDEAPMTEGRMMGLLLRWRGTGRYASEERSTITMGSGMSVAMIWDDVKRSGLVDPDDADGRSARFSLNDAGRRFLDLLHPDCRDPDLPWRVREWQDAGRSSEPKVDRYVRTFFGRQKRFAAR